MMLTSTTEELSLFTAIEYIERKFKAVEYINTY